MTEAGNWTQAAWGDYNKMDTGGHRTRGTVNSYFEAGDGVRISAFSEATRGIDWSAEFIPQRRSIVNNPAE